MRQWVWAKAFKYCIYMYLVGIGCALAEVISQRAVGYSLKRLVHYRGSDAIQPAVGVCVCVHACLCA